MVKGIIKIAFLCGVALLFSCKKAEDRACFKSIGEESTLTIPFASNIDSLYLNDNIFYTLVPGEEAKVEITGGKNLISFIDVHSDNGNLHIGNGNKCAFLRSYDYKIEAKVYVKDITFIEYRGSSELKSQDTLFSPELRLNIKDGAGDVNLTVVNGYTSAKITHGFGNLILKGSALTAFLSCNTNSYCDAREFHTTDKLTVTSNTVSEMLINADNIHLDARIHRKGNIRYVGTPSSIALNRTGTGQLIDIN